jgi:hypothetical protein
MLMSEHIHKRWTIQLLTGQHDNGLWACPYVCQENGKEPAVEHRNELAGLWDTKEEAEAASLAHAKAWIDARCVISVLATHTRFPTHFTTLFTTTLVCGLARPGDFLWQRN